MMYSVLVPEERQVLDAYVVSHPDLAPLLEEAKEWTGLLQQARLLMEAEPPDEALAYFLVTQALSRHPLPGRLRRVFEDLSARVAARPELQARMRRLAVRLRELEAADPFAQFAALTGRSI